MRYGALFSCKVQLHLSKASFKPLTPDRIKHFHWLTGLFWPIRFEVTIVSVGNNCNVKPNWPESPFGIVVKSNLTNQIFPVNERNPLYKLVLLSFKIRATLSADSKICRKLSKTC